MSTLPLQALSKSSKLLWQGKASVHKARDLGGNFADLAQSLGAWSERVSDPNEVANAILRARRATEDGKTCLLEVMTSAETAFSHRGGKKEGEGKGDH